MESDAPLFRGAAAIVRHWGDVADDGYFKADGLHGTDGRFSAGSWTFYTDFDLSETVTHGLFAGILRDHLGGISRALSRALEAAFSGAGPSDDGAFLVRDAHDGVVEARLNVGDAMNDILAALGFHDF